MWRLERANGDPRFTELSRAREYTQLMKERGELRSSPGENGEVLRALAIFGPRPSITSLKRRTNWGNGVTALLTQLLK